MQEVIVIKQDIHGKETWRYAGCILQHLSNGVLLEAHFNRPDLPFHGMVLRENDRFIEAYYTDNWFNIFEIYDRDDDSLKGWYCNVTYPASINDREVSYRDLALDLLVFPDGRQIVLDEDEFANLEISPEDRTRARQALKELQAIFKSPPAVRLNPAKPEA